MHEGVLGGHLGQEKTLQRVKERYYWPGLFTDVRTWCETCAKCATRKSPPYKARAPMQSVRCGYPAQLVAVDIVGPLVESLAGNRYILVVGDYFTRWVEAYAIPNQEATTVAKKITEEFFFRYSPPEQLHSDQGRQFESTLVQEVCKLLGVHKTRTTPYHPQSDGMIERFNKTMVNMLATAVSDRPFDWEDYLRPLCLAYNTSVHATTGSTPYFLMFGRQVNMPLDIVYGTAVGTPVSPSEYARDLRKRLEDAYCQVRTHTGQQQEVQKQFYNQRVHGSQFAVGDRVFLNSPATPNGQARKFHCPWVGPFRIKKRLSDAVYRIQSTRPPKKKLIVHFNRLKPCPPNLRLDEVEATTTPDNPDQSRTVTPPPPPGTHIEIIDQPLPAPPTPRYPTRIRHAPDYYTGT